MGSLRITNGRIIDPSQDVDQIGDLLIDDGKIVGIDAEGEADETFDASGKIVSPGLIDLHVELRDPGREEDETIESGTAAALAGGFTSIVCTANTDPPLDSQAGVEFVRQKAARAGNCNVYVLACISKNRDGEQLAELGSLVTAGAVGFSDAGRSVQNADLLRRALQYCLMFDKPLLNPAEKLELSQDGVMHEGLVSLQLGLPGMPAEAEDVMIARDLRLAEATGGRLHLMNISTAGSVEMVHRAKERGVRVTAAVSPYHFCLTDEKLRTFDPNFKVNPPLRSQEHVDACIAGLQGGAIDVIASSHSPRAAEKKRREIDLAPFGVIGLETALASVITHLIEPGRLDWLTALSKLTTGPASILGIDKGTLRPGADADVTIINPNVFWTVDPDLFLSKCANTPFAGVQLQGRAERVFVAGETKYIAGELKPAG